MGAWKAPGPDGFPPGFFQKSWHVVGTSVVDFVQGIWQDPNDIVAVNTTDICLIPKVEKPEFVAQFRPISLCNTIYKVVTKIVVNRLKDLMDTLISPYQTGFIPRRHIHENIVVAQELVHSMRRMRGRTGGLAIKVDLAKAYDRLKWSFIHLVLLEAKLPEKLIKIIMTCITSVQTNVMWNGNRSPFFSPQRGIRQGDPLSPYIFVLCMDKLSHLISHEVEKGTWNPLRAGRSGPTVSHLMFADDLLLFGDASLAQMNCMVSTLDTFCAMSGQQVNIEKTAILFSPIVPSRLRRRLTQHSGFKEVNRLGKYLGIPLTGHAPRRADYEYLVDMVRSKLANWKTTQLSFAGRVTLSKAVIEALPLYPMMTSVIPKSCLRDIQQLQRRFIWGEEGSQRKYHVVAWNTVTRPKRLGGLGIRNLVDMNTACIMKLTWALQKGESKLWCNVLRGKYGRDFNGGDITVRASDSTLWKQIGLTWELIDNNCFWSIGDGQSISVWEDSWIVPGYRLLDTIDQLPQDLHGLRLCDLVNEDGNWNLDLILPFIPATCVERIKSLLPPSEDHGRDNKLWIGNSHGEFSVASSYMILTNLGINPEQEVWKNIWKLSVPERVRAFVWLVFHDRLLTNKRKHQMGLGVSYCDHCNEEIETTIHVLRDCPLATSLWMYLVRPEYRSDFFVGDCKNWVRFNMISNICDLGNVRWSSVWAIACHNLWSWRNKEAHDSSFIRPFRPWRLVLKLAKDYMLCSNSGGLMQPPDMEWRDIHWVPPLCGWYCLNTDGAVKNNGIIAGCGGLIRDHLGN